MTSYISDLLESVLALFFQPFKAPHVNIFSRERYHPIFGSPGVVDEPQIDLNTSIPSTFDFKQIRNINGDFGTHITSTNAFKRAYLHKKLQGKYDNALVTQLDRKYASRPFIGKHGHFLDSGSMLISSREHISDRTPKKHPYYDYMKSTQLKNYDF
jgi:hypothetical protein